MAAEIIAVIKGLSQTLDLAKKAKGFFETFDSRKRKLFRQYIDPAFADLQPVFDSYADIISAFRKDMANAKNYSDMQVALDEYVAKRQKTARHRSKVVPALEATLEHMTAEMTLSKCSRANELLLEFMDSLSSYFVCSSFNYSRSKRFEFAIKTYDAAGLGLSFASSLIQMTTGIIERRKMEDGDFSKAKKIIVRSCDGAIHALEERSSILHKSFMKLKLECMEN